MYRYTYKPTFRLQNITLPFSPHSFIHADAGQRYLLAPGPPSCIFSLRLARAEWSHLVVPWHLGGHDLYGRRKKSDQPGLSARSAATCGWWEGGGKEKKTSRLGAGVVVLSTACITQAARGTFSLLTGQLKGNKTACGVLIRRTRTRIEPFHSPVPLFLFPNVRKVDVAWDGWMVGGGQKDGRVEAL